MQDLWPLRELWELRMAPERFSWILPEPQDDRGLVALDCLLTADRLESAYRHGIFPWPASAEPRRIPWVCPSPRAILRFDALHVPKSLRRSRQALRHIHFTIDCAFTSVIHACSVARRRGQRGTWITAPMIEAYTELHQRGHAHSVEAWDGTNLVGGLYGVTVGGVFAGESMFHRLPNVSKLCVLHLIDHLRARGSTWLDIQQLTPHFAVLGAEEISRAEFLAKLAREQGTARTLFP